MSDENGLESEARVENTLLPLLVLKQAIVLPTMEATIDVPAEQWGALVRAAEGHRGLTLVAVPQRDPQHDAPASDGNPLELLWGVGTACALLRAKERPNGSLALTIRGLHRVELVSVDASATPWTSTVQTARELGAAEAVLTPEDEALPPTEARPSPSQSTSQRVRDSLLALGELANSRGTTRPSGRNDIEAIRAAETVRELVDRGAALLGLDRAGLVAILVELDVKQRLEQFAQIAEARLGQEKEMQQVAAAQREQALRSQMKEILEELGEADEESQQSELMEKIRAAGMSREAEEAALKQARRLQSIPEASPEHSITRNYVEWLTDLPWSKSTSSRGGEGVDLSAARAQLDADHYGLEKVKRRMIEYLAVRKLKPDKKGPILCLVGPPGVGKTSLGRSIAKALGREFTRISLGGVRDEAEIRGHRRTYIGALPGRILQALKRVGVRNPVLLLDEIDKLGADFRGDPASALLEVLDPEQNHTFSDHYIEVPFDLSEVIFVATANDLSTIPSALRDRLEILSVPGYSVTEKRHIAVSHLLPKQLSEHGLEPGRIELTDGAIEEIAATYTREAGVRNLERELAAIVRSVAVDIAAGTTAASAKEGGQPVRVDRPELETYLGPAKFFNEVAGYTESAGVATGLAWTPTGGELLFIEATRMPGKGNLVLTGQLGDVMRESAMAALSFVRANAARWGFTTATFMESDIHLHVPAGATPKDGPSAGAAMATAFVSLLTGQRVRSDTAMTGEVTLRGTVLPVGGIASKVLAAHRAGIRRVLLPERNAKDLVEIPAEVRAGIELMLVKRMADVLSLALDTATPEPAAPVPLPGSSAIPAPVNPGAAAFGITAA
jgi:ATP-dependent Lon protease